MTRSVLSRPHGGLTLIELLITLAITAILIAVAAPSMREFIEKQKVEGAANELANDVRYLRSMSMQKNNIMLLSFRHTSAMSCYSLIEYGKGTGTCDCSRSPAAICDAVVGADTEIKSVYLPVSGGVSVQSSLPQLQLAGNGGMVAGELSMTASVSSPAGGEVRVSVNAGGRASICNVSGHSSTFPDCQ